MLKYDLLYDTFPHILQLFATLYLLYTQIGLAFIGGVIFAIILIPITRWLANQISVISKEFLEAKDARVSQTSEALSGAKQIKVLAWEDVFVERIQGKSCACIDKNRHSDELILVVFSYTKKGAKSARQAKILRRLVRVLLGNHTNHYQIADICDSRRSSSTDDCCHCVR